MSIIFKNDVNITIYQSDLQRIVAKYINDKYSISRILPKNVKFSMQGDLVVADFKSITDMSIRIYEED